MTGHQSPRGLLDLGWVLCHGAMVWAIIEAEPWTPLSLIAGGLLLVGIIFALVWAIRVSVRR